MSQDFAATADDDFTALIDHVVCSFKKGAVITGQTAVELVAKGAPVTEVVVAKSAEDLAIEKAAEKEAKAAAAAERKAAADAKKAAAAEKRTAAAQAKPATPLETPGTEGDAPEVEGQDEDEDLDSDDKTESPAS
jgi:membrane protein involved in colicin uptake